MSRILEHGETEKRRLIILLLCFSVSLCLIFNTIHAQSGQPPNADEQTYDIAKKLNCPTCAGRNLADCPTETCAQWKAEIKAQLEAGKTSEEVLDYFKTRFGPTVLQEPPKEGTTLVLWALPIVAAVALVVVAILVARHVSSRSPTPASTPSASQTVASSATPADPFVTQLEEQVREES
jgi:cytochrome c-type biogenesis protein CcmH